jgi:hypothetical protein
LPQGLAVLLSSHLATSRKRGSGALSIVVGYTAAPVRVLRVQKHFQQQLTLDGLLIVRGPRMSILARSMTIKEDGA